MAQGKSLLSLRGEINWVTGDYSNIVADTKRLVAQSNGAALGEMRTGARGREQQFKQSLSNIDKMEKDSAATLLKSKKNIAKRAMAIRIKSTTPIPPKARTTAALKTAGKEMDETIRAAETGYGRLKKLMKANDITGMAGRKLTKKSLTAFGEMGAGKRGRVMDLERQVQENAKTRIESTKKEYALLKKKNTSEAYWMRDKIKREEKIIVQSKARGKILWKVHKESETAEKRDADLQRKTGQMRKRLFGDFKKMKNAELQMERETLQMNREVAEEMGRIRQEVGDGLRQAFTYATVAVTAFWYKLQPVVDTFMEFEKQLINAQSIWQESNEVLFELSDQVVIFGQNFGINMGQATEGLYQYASAGVEAADAMNMLNHTLTLSMAVQGDHNTLAKLTTQTIMGFGMEFSDAAEVTDKFAHAINKSLIEWDDLASSIKFALPFFISTGQSLDQLLGALQVLTNRALEAGIAGRGLRQALAEFTQHAEDNSAAFHKMGVEILDVDGNMRELTDIAGQFQAQLGEGVNDMDVMMALMEDLNIRGATAFVHLVQNADEFQSAVNDLENSAGSAASMAEVQQKSLANQIQLVKNALQAPFLMSEKMGEGQEYINSFAQQLHMMVQSFQDLIVVEVDGQKQLTEFGEFIKEFVIVAMKELQEVMALLVGLIKSFGDQSESAAALLHLLTIPIKIVLRLLTALGPELLTTMLVYSKLNQILPLNSLYMYNNIQMRLLEIEMMKRETTAVNTVSFSFGAEITTKEASTVANEKYIATMKRQILTQIAMKLIMFSMIYATQKYAKDSALMAGIIGALAGAFMGLAFAINAAWGAAAGGPPGLGTAMAIGAAAGGTFNVLLHQMMKGGPKIDMPEFAAPVEMDTGGRILPMYATGGRARPGEHFPVMVESGETITSKTQNMLGGGGITLNIGDVYTNDAEDFAERIAMELPRAMRRQSDIGGI